MAIAEGLAVASIAAAANFRNADVNHADVNDANVNLSKSRLGTEAAFKHRRLSAGDD